MRTSPLLLAVVAAACLAAPAGAQSGKPDEAARVRFLIVADTDAREGAACALDAANIRAVLEAGLQRQALDGRYTIDTLVGREVTPGRILAYYRNLKAGPNDALVFFYAGHGAYHSKKGHLLTLMYGDLSRAALLAAMQKHQPRLAVLLTDCCAILDDAPPPGAKPPSAIAPKLPLKRGPGVADGPPTAPAHPPRPKNYVPPPAADDMPIAEAPHPPRPDNWRPPPPVDPSFQGYVPGKGGVVLYGHDGALALKTLTAETDGSVMRHLFYRHRGVVDINGCQKGQGAYAAVAWGGGLFTSSFLALQREKVARFDGNRNGTAEWGEFFPQLQARCERSASALTKGKIRQVPEATRLGQPVLTVAAR